MRWLSLLVLFAACSSEAPAADRFTLVCESWFRASETVPPGIGQKLALPVNVPRWPVPEIGVPPKVTTAKHQDFIVKLSVVPGIAYLDILDAQTGKQIQRHLWQFSKVPVNNFGGTQQGFTGLNYVYHPVTKSELQFVCKVAKARGKGGAE